MMYRVLKPFEFLEPSTLEEALKVLSVHGPKAKVLAGGVELVLYMRLRKILPAFVVSIQKIPELDYIRKDGSKTLRIGALATLLSIERSPLIKSDFPLLFEAVHQIASVQAKNMGTAVGNICAGTPASDVASVLLVLGAALKIQSTRTKREVPLEDFFVGAHKTILEPDEVVTEIVVPSVPNGTGYAFLKLAKTKAEIAKLNVSVAITVADNVCEDIKIALGSVAPTPLRVRRAEEILKGQRLDEKRNREAAETAASAATPISDLWSTAAYRTEMIKTLVARGIDVALKRADK